MSAYDNIVAALETAGMTVKGNPGKSRAQCPTHHSAGLTLSVREGEGRALLHCFAGCQDADVLADLGLEVRDLFDDDRPGAYVAPRRAPSAWETAMAEIGVHNPPPIEHVLDRMVRENSLEAHPAFWAQRDREIAEARKIRDDDRPGGAVTEW